MEHPATSFTVKAADLNKVMSQAELLSSSGTESTITFTKDVEGLTLKGSNIDCKINTEGEVSDFSLEFKLNSLHQVLSSYGDVVIHVAPLLEDPEDLTSQVVGVLVWNDELTTCIAGAE